jgi:hypothetical protein
MRRIPTVLLLGAVLVLLPASHPSHAQREKVSISGQVTNEEKEGLSRAVVGVIRKKGGPVKRYWADDKGRYTIEDAPAPLYALTFAHTSAAGPVVLLNLSGYHPTNVINVVLPSEKAAETTQLYALRAVQDAQLIIALAEDNPREWSGDEVMRELVRKPFRRMSYGKGSEVTEALIKGNIDATLRLERIFKSKLGKLRD